MPAFKDLTGQFFGHLEVLYKDEEKTKKEGRTFWFCQCNCKNKTIVSISTSQLTSGKTRSCGCLRRQSLIEYNKANKKKTNKIIQDTINKCGKIILTNSNKEALIDIEDIEKISNFTWRLDTNGYVVCPLYNEVSKKYDLIGRLHRIIMDCPKGYIVDHINGNKLDNRKDNLRICTQSDNTKNHVIGKNNTSGYSGIIYNKDNKNWRVRIGDKEIGSFFNFEDAVIARKDAEEKYFGEYSYDNSRIRRTIV